MLRDSEGSDGPCTSHGKGSAVTKKPLPAA